MTEAAKPCERGASTAELALGLVSGVERAEALAHLGQCADCRAEVEEFADVADRVLLLTPPAEPPPGFESAVLAAMRPTEPERRTKRRRGRFVLPLASAAAAAALALAAGWALGARSPTTEGARQADMITPSGRDVGEVRLEDGEPAWVLVSVPGWKRWDAAVGEPLDYLLRVDLRDGRRIEMTDVELSPAGEWASSVPFDPAEVAAVYMVDRRGHVWCKAELAAPS